MDIFSHSQCSFRKDKSTERALLKLVGMVVDGFLKGKDMMGTLCDATKAFDCLNVNILLRK